MRQHGERKRLAKTTRTDEKEILICILDLLYETCLVNVVTIVPAHMLEVHHAVGYALRLPGYLLLTHRPSVFCSPREDNANRTQNQQADLSVLLK